MSQKNITVALFFAVGLSIPGIALSQPDPLAEPESLPASDSSPEAASPEIPAPAEEAPAPAAAEEAPAPAEAEEAPAPAEGSLLTELPGRVDALDAMIARGGGEFDATYLSPRTAIAALPSRNAAGVFAFVRDGFAYEPYRGRIRGARGAMFSRAGNAVDLSLLAAAMLDELGVEWRLVRGTLSDEAAERLLSAAAPDATLGGSLSVLVSEAQPSSLRWRTVQDHLWLEARRGGG